jgi:uncharacterized protein
MDTHLLICLGIGFAIGATMGLTGAGGGILAVPALVISLGWSMQQAAPVALVAVAGAAAAGSIHGLRHNLVRYRAALLMALVSLPFSSAGVLLAHRLSQRVLFLLFAAIVVVVAIRLLSARAADTGVRGEGRACGIDPDTGRFTWTWPTACRLGAMGAVAGCVSGLLGVSGGFLVVPMLHGFTALGMQAIVATSLFVTALISLGSVTNALLHGAHLPLAITAAFASALIAGLLLARRLGRGLPQLFVQRGFAVLLMLVALKLVLQALAAS